jgi:hypothetical protein
VLHNISKRDDHDEENQRITSELQSIFQEAQNLLCTIETFVNETTNKNNSNLIYWYTKREIMDLVKLTDPKGNGSDTVKEKTSYLFVVGRFGTYINKLYERVEKFNLEKNLENRNNKLLRSIQRHPKQNRKHRRRNQKEKSKKMRIVTTARPAIINDNIVNLKNKKMQNKSPEKRRKRINTSLRN